MSYALPRAVNRQRQQQQYRGNASVNVGIEPCPRVGVGNVGKNHFFPIAGRPPTVYTNPEVSGGSLWFVFQFRPHPGRATVRNHSRFGALLPLKLDLPFRPEM